LGRKVFQTFPDSRFGEGGELNYADVSGIAVDDRGFHRWNFDFFPDQNDVKGKTSVSENRDVHGGFRGTPKSIRDVLGGKPFRGFSFNGVDVVSRVDAGSPTRCVFNGRDDFDVGKTTEWILRIEPVFADVEPDSSVLAFGGIGHLLQDFTIQIKRIRIVQVGKQTVHGALEELLGIHFVNIVALNHIESGLKISNIVLGTSATIGLS
jgi:hypothetical protein